MDIDSQYSDPSPTAPSRDSEASCRENWQLAVLSKTTSIAGPRHQRFCPPWRGHTYFYSSLGQLYRAALAPESPKRSSQAV